MRCNYSINLSRPLSLFDFPVLLSSTSVFIKPIMKIISHLPYISYATPFSHDLVSGQISEAALLSSHSMHSTVFPSVFKVLKQYAHASAEQYLMNHCDHDQTLTGFDRVVSRQAGIQLFNTHFFDKSSYLNYKTGRMSTASKTTHLTVPDVSILMCNR